MTTPVLCVNRLYEYAGGTVIARTERLLWVDQSSAIAVLINVFSNTAREHRIAYSSFYDDVSHGVAKPVEEPPLFSYFRQPANAFSRPQLLERDERLAAIDVFLKAPPEQRFDPIERSRLFSQITSRIPRLTSEDLEALTDPVVIQLLERTAYKGVSHESIRNPLHLNRGTLYHIYRLYLQRGQMENALISARHCAGWFTENRLEHPPTKKLGRAWTADSPEAARSGLIVTPEIEQKLLQIGELFHEQRVEGAKLSWREAVQRGNECFFSRGWKPDGDILVPDMPPASDLPTVPQVQRAYYKHKHYGETILAREGEREFNLKHRPLTDDQRAIAYGPMHLVQADFWDIPIYCVHPITREVIGTPKLAMMRDTMSRMIVASTPTWEYEGWKAAVLAFENLVEDKTEHCARFDIECLPEWWPCSGLIFEKLLSDNGPYITKNAGHLRQTLGIEILNTGTGRGDMKPVIESGFDDIYDKVIKTLPGALPPHAIKGDDPRTKRAWERATLDIHQLQSILLYYDISYNRFRYLEDYPLTDDMKGVVRPIPIELWNWGIIKRSGSLRPMSLDTIRLNCLEQAEATVTGEGIVFQDLYFSCARCEREQWQVKARKLHWWRVRILFDRLNLNGIYLLRNERDVRPGESRLEPCWRIRARGERTDLHLEEVLFEQRRRAVEKNTYGQEMPQHDAWLHAHVDTIAKDAITMTRKSLGRGGQTKGDLRKKRHLARDEERREAYPNGATHPAEQPANNTQTPDALPQHSRSEFDIFAKVLERKKGDM
jgi:putative transposase